MTYRGGSANPQLVAKSARFYEIARENRLPVIILNESAGADLPRQADIFVPGGGQFRDLTASVARPGSRPSPSASDPPRLAAPTSRA